MSAPPRQDGTETEIASTTPQGEDAAQDTTVVHPTNMRSHTPPTREEEILRQGASAGPEDSRMKSTMSSADSPPPISAHVNNDPSTSSSNSRTDKEEKVFADSAAVGNTNDAVGDHSQQAPPQTQPQVPQHSTLGGTAGEFDVSTTSSTKSTEPVQVSGESCASNAHSEDVAGVTACANVANADDADVTKTEIRTENKVGTENQSEMGPGTVSTNGVENEADEEKISASSFPADGDPKSPPSSSSHSERPSSLPTTTATTIPAATTQHHPPSPHRHPSKPLNPLADTLQAQALAEAGRAQAALQATASAAAGIVGGAGGAVNAAAAAAAAAAGAAAAAAAAAAGEAFSMADRGEGGGDGDGLRFSFFYRVTIYEVCREKS